MSSVERPENLTDDLLLVRVEELVHRRRRVEAELIWHLAEVDRRRLYRREACSSMHAYATSRLHLSEAEAYLRIAVARASRRFPVVLRMLADGRLHVSAIAKLAPHLDEKNCDSLLAAAVHRSKREIEKLVARLAPHPDVPSGIRLLPGARPTELRPGGVDNRGVAEKEAASPVADACNVGARSAPPSPGANQPVAPRPAAPRCAAVVAPLSESKYRVQFTAGEELQAKILRAQALMRHQNHDGDLAVVFDRAMTLLIRELERVRYAATSAPRKTAAETDPTPSSRRIPDAVRREVWVRDGEQCTFRDRHERRCTARERLEFHHIIPFANGGEHSVDNVTLRCASHNAYQADLDFGADFMAERREGRGKPGGGGRCGEALAPGFGFAAASSPGSSAPPRLSVLGPPLMNNALAVTGFRVARYSQRPPAPQRSRVGFNTHL